MGHISLLVTGGAGFVGAHVVRLAVEKGYRVVVLDDHSGGPPARLPTEVEMVRGDIGDAALVGELCGRHRVTALLHFAGKIQVGESMREPARYFDVNMVRSVRMLDAAIAAGVSAVIYSSTAAVYGSPAHTPIPEQAALAPVSPYGSSKLAVEYVLQAYGNAYGLRWAALRYFNAAGAHPDGTLREAHDPETHLVPLAIDAALGRRPALALFGDDYPTSDGTCVRDYVHVCDLADAHLAALATLDRSPVGALNLGSGLGSSVREVLAATRQVCGVEVPHVIAPRRSGDPPILCADATRAADVLGWRPRRSALETILEDALRSRR
jgi:UDP-glucose-4-epimerase GalE